jgi:hypothetical protein
MRALENVLLSPEAKVHDLERLYSSERHRAEFLEHAVRLIEVMEAEDAWRVLWLLRRAAEDGELPQRDLGRVLQNLGLTRHWTWRLVACQLLAAVDCPRAEREYVADFLFECFEDRRVIVRAWALSALWRGWAGEERTRDCMKTARRDPAKAMQARLRQLGRPERRLSGKTGAESPAEAQPHRPSRGRAPVDATSNKNPSRTAL